ncbi:MAG: cytochrome c biogenesis protein CcsA [Candidatus Neomarinimicrobiota bacterium]|nr:cytochrome c biogenesis protein CcsA [Candidatus Neomarinimicrobiota bacterium]
MKLKATLNVLIVSLMLFDISGLYAKDFSEKNIPIQEGGRIKPLDTYARNQTLAFYGKRKINHEDLSAIDWILDLVIFPEKGLEQKIFNIRNPDIVNALGLEWTNNFHKYSYSEIFPGVQDQLPLIRNIFEKKDEDRDLFENQLIEIYQNVMKYREISSSLSCLLPMFTVYDPGTAKKLHLQPGQFTSYAHIMSHRGSLLDVSQNILTKPEESWTDSEREVALLLYSLQQTSTDDFAKALKIIPPEKDDSTGLWISPWELLDGRVIEPHQDKILKSMEAYLVARYEKNSVAMTSALESYKTGIVSSPAERINFSILEKEIWVNKANLFTVSLIFYLLGVILLGVSWMVQPTLLKNIAYGTMVSGFILHTYGIYLRMVIMSRPPISTLYETVIFVGFVIVLFSVVIEYLRKDGLGIFIGSISGSLLHYVGFGYAADGDTMEMLVAVLNSNFWLATHVTTIILGYGSSLMAGLIGHLYLIEKIRVPKQRAHLKSIYDNMFGVTLIALFFTLFGTILGGIWADQSWGRFWGWDPKENGALLIVLWQLMMVHMRLSGLAKPDRFALGMVLNNIVVIMAWFGVNLLSIGLHSYGFASGIAVNIVIFTIVELVTGFGTYYWARLKNKQVTA